MDKLQPLIKHRYWIIFSFAVIFVIVGWWLASGAIATATETRRKSVEDSFTKAAQGKNDPNAAWVKVAQDQNAVDEKSKLSAAKMLWERQQKARTWPESLAKDFQSVPFQGEVKEVQTRRKWKRVYKTQIESLLEIVKPYQAKTKEGVVVVSVNSIDHKPFGKWKYQDPVSAEIWTCQEDIWLMQSLLTSIARVNGEAKRITEANVRKINRLSLRGGDPAATPSAAGGGGGGMMGSMGGGDMTMGGGLMAGNGMGMSSMGGGGSGGGAGAASYPGKEFEGNSGSDILAEEFGAVAGAGGMGGMGDGSMGSSMMGSMMGGDSGGAPAEAPVEEDRYVDEVEGQYKTRAFLLDVIVRDDQLPNLLASLTNSDFPVEIRRVEVLSGVVSTGGANAGSGGGSMSMMGGSPGMNLGGGGGGGGGGGDDGDMASGMGMGMGSSGSSGMSGGLDMGDTGMGMGGMGMGGMGMSGMGMGGMGLGGPGAAGGDPVAIALADPLLVTVKIGGLMTLYQSLAETNAQEETEKAAETEQSSSAPPDPADLTSTEPDAEMSGDAAATDTAPAEGAADATNAGSTEAPAEQSASDAVEKPADGEEKATNGDESKSSETTDGEPQQTGDQPAGSTGESTSDSPPTEEKSGSEGAPSDAPPTEGSDAPSGESPK